MKKLVLVAVLLFVFCSPVSANSWKWEIPFPPVSLPISSLNPNIINQIVVGKTIVAELSGRYLSPAGEEWKSEEKFFLLADNVIISYPPIGTHPRAVVSGNAYDRYNKILGQFKATIDALSSKFFQFSIVLNKQDGAQFTYEGDLYLLDEKLKGIFLSERREPVNGLPVEIGSGKTELYLE